jgi:hypothetical protein
MLGGSTYLLSFGAFLSKSWLGYIASRWHIWVPHPNFLAWEEISLMKSLPLSDTHQDSMAWIEAEENERGILLVEKAEDLAFDQNTLVPWNSNNTESKRGTSLQVYGFDYAQVWQTGSWLSQRLSEVNPYSFALCAPIWSFILFLLWY